MSENLSRLRAEADALAEYFETRDIKGARALAVMGMLASFMLANYREGVEDTFCSTLKLTTALKRISLERDDVHTSH